MAVQNYLTNNASAVGEKTEPTSNLQEISTLVGAAAILAADDDGSTYLIAKAVPSSFRPQSIVIATDGITGGTDYELGLYDTVTGTVVSKGLFMTGQTMASASRSLDGLANVSVADLAARKTIAELLSLTPTTAKAAYDIVLTADTVGSGAGNVLARITGFAG